MLSLKQCCCGPRNLLAVGFALSLAAPALAADFYRWKTVDGAYAFTDDAKRIPERYRKTAQKISIGGLSSYAHFTPDRSVRNDSAVKLALGRDPFRAADAVLRPRPPSPYPQVTQAPAPPYPYPPVQADHPNDLSAIRIGSQNGPALDLSSGREGSGPLIIEERRVRADGGFVTRTDTIVRRGDEILAVIKPRAHETYTPDIQDDRDLESH